MWKCVRKCVRVCVSMRVCESERAWVCGSMCVWEIVWDCECETMWEWVREHVSMRSVWDMWMGEHVWESMWVWVREHLSVYEWVCGSMRGVCRVCESERAYEWVCVRVSERACECEKCVWVCESENMCERICECECVRARERVMGVWVRKRVRAHESVRKCWRSCVWGCVREHVWQHVWVSESVCAREQVQEKQADLFSYYSAPFFQFHFTKKPSNLNSPAFPTGNNSCTWANTNSCSACQLDFSL